MWRICSTPRMRAEARHVASWASGEESSHGEQLKTLASPGMVANLGSFLPLCISCHLDMFLLGVGRNGCKRHALQENRRSSPAGPRVANSWPKHASTPRAHRNSCHAPSSPHSAGPRLGHKQLLALHELLVLLTRCSTPPSPD